MCPAVGLKGTGWPYLAADGASGGTGWWKLRAIQEDVENTGPDAVAWVDDQARLRGGSAAMGTFPGQAHPHGLTPSPARNHAP
ncbi:hypothetical protein NG819_14120 [Pseudarthrobacter sp. Fe7]|nr:hypothetical protein NG819_14120 [Pseudarthrobacter sp. Fe7]